MSRVLAVFLVGVCWGQESPGAARWKGIGQALPGDSARQFPALIDPAQEGV